MIYKTSLDNLSKAITVFVTISFAIIIVGEFALIKDQEKVVPIYTTVLVLSVYAVALIFRPLYYELLDDKLIVNRFVSDISIYRNQISSVEIITKKEIGWVVRVFGVGGLFGYFGKFSNFKMGSMTWYATRRDRMILIKTMNGEKIILTPDEPEKFVAELMSSITRA